MTDTRTRASTAPRKAWHTPDLAVIPAAAAENTANPIGADGILSRGS